MSAKHEFSTATFWPERERVCDTYSVNYLDVHGAKEYKKTVDVYIRLNEDFYINLEINREIFKYASEIRICSNSLTSKMVFGFSFISISLTESNPSNIRW